MKFLVIWFILTSQIGSEQGVVDTYYHMQIEIKEKKNCYSYIYQNYIIVDSFEEAKRVAEEKTRRGDMKVYIYELGKQYEAKRHSYQVKELRNITKYNCVFEEKK